MTFALLHTLRPNAKVRNTPLKQLRAECRNKGNRLESGWRDCSNFKIGAYTYNELSDNWTANTEFRIKLNQPKP